jgi:hypothetical protein
MTVASLSVGAGSGGGLGGGELEDTLQQDEVEPAVEFEANLGEVGYAFEAQTFVQANGAGVFGVDAADDDVFAEAASDWEELKDELGADSLVAVVGMDVDGVFDGEAVAGPGAEVAEGGEAENGFCVVCGNEDGVAGADAGVKPVEAIVEGDGGVVVGRGGVDDDVVVDGKDAGDVGLGGGTDEHGFLR